MNAMRSNPRRLLSAAVAIFIGVAFVAATLVLGDTFKATLGRDAAGQVGDSAVVVTTSRSVGEPISAAYVDAVRATPGVASARPSVVRYVTQQAGNGGVSLRLSTVPPLTATTRLTAGRLPQAAGEIAVNTVVVDNRGVALGQRIRIDTGPKQGASAPVGPSYVDATVVGILAAERDALPRPKEPAAFVRDADLFAWTAARGYDEIYVAAKPEVSADSLVAAVQALPGSASYVVRTGDQERQARIDAVTGDTGVLTAVLLAFTAIAMLVSGVVIANTFGILLAQRVRELGLLRCVGATRRQVFRGVLLEALVLALLASALGVVAGVGLIALLVAVSQGTDLALAPIALTPQNLLAPVLVGLAVTMVSVVVPARRATRVAPLAALRPDLAAPTGSRGGQVRIGLGALAFVGGSTLLVLMARSHSIEAAILGGMISVLGVVLLGPVLVPALARALGVPTRALGTPAELAVDNSRRNPGRAAATSTALFIGVALITMMSVGAASMQATSDAVIDRRTVVDAVVMGPDSLGPATLEAVRRTAGVAAAVPVPVGEVALTTGSVRSVTSVAGVSDETRQVLPYTQYVDGVGPDTIVLPGDLGIKDGERVTVGEGASALQLRAVVWPRFAKIAVLTATNLRAVNPTAPVAVWARFSDGADPYVVNDALVKAVSPTAPTAAVGGAAVQRAEINRVVQVMLLVVSGLLGVSVLIALVGVGNTLSLSVLERTRETGLLRALGVTRRQVRAMLGVEALTLAGAGTLLGIGLGIGYGIAGAHALLGERADIIVAIPWGRLAVVLAIALLAGWLASVLPGARASRVAPSVALAGE